MSIDQIKSGVLHEGLVSPGFRYARSGNRLKNKFYYGFFEWQGVEYRGKHPLITPKATLDKVKRLLEAEQALFGGWIKCGHPECGRVIIYDPKKKLNKTTGEWVVHRYYHCANSRKVHTSLRGLSIHEEDLMGEFQSLFFSISIPDQLAQDIAEAINQSEAASLEAIRNEAYRYFCDTLQQRRIFVE